MLCACSREQQFHFEEAPQSPESLATRDFSVSGLSSRTADGEAKFDDNQVDDIESALRETLSLNYEEARALLGRLEYQRGNLDAALQVFQGIDVRGLKPRMVKAIAERSRPRKARAKGENMLVNVMSMHSVSLLLEAILLKSKSLEGLGRVKDSAMECKTILDIVESAWPHGMSQGVADDCRLKEIFHKALELLPELWKQAGHLDETVSAYRRALIKPWNLDPEKCATFQKDLAAILLYGGEEVTLPLQLQQVWGSTAPKTNIEEASLLLLILMKKVLFQEISWDPEIMDHLGFAPQPSSLSGETYPELVKRLDEALLNFIEGPPFTLQRLCEILLTPKSIYKSLSKLALALEKNLLVTSTLTVCTDPYPRTVSLKPAEPDRVIEESHAHAAPVPNGLKTITGDGDEEMVEAEADEDAPSVDTEIDAQVADTEVNQGQVADTEVHNAKVADTEVNQGQVADPEVHDAQVADTEAQDAKNVDTEMQEEKVSEAPESNPEPSSDSGPATEPCTTSEENCPTPPQP